MENFRIFEYVRKDKVGNVKFKAQLIVNGYNIMCYGETVIPAGTSDETALKFFEDAENATMKAIDDQLMANVGD